MSNTSLTLKQYHCFLTCFFLLVGFGILFYKGPGQPFIRSYVGDFIATPFLYFALCAFWNTRMVWKALAVLTVAVTVEVFQLFHLLPQTTPAAIKVALGSHFDSLDLVAYVLGLTAACVADYLLQKKLGRQ